MAKHASEKRFLLVTASLLLLLVVLIILSLLKGAVDLQPQAVWQVLWHSDKQGLDPVTYDVIWNLRLPRILVAILIGLHFAISGLILQAVIRNPLADPSVIGISSGAGLGAVIFLLLGDLYAGRISSEYFSGTTVIGLPFAALFGGVLAALLVLGLSWKHRMEPAKLALNGVAVGAFFNALVIWVVIVWGAGRTETSLIWLAGSIYGRDFEHLTMLLPWTLVSLTMLLLMLKPLSLLRFDEMMAVSLGMSIKSVRLLAILLAVAFAASAVSISGPVGFIGLIVPHLARLLVGSDFKHLAVTSLLSGAALMLIADFFGRWIVSPVELPAGAITTLIGIPVFLILLQRSIWRKL